MIEAPVIAGSMRRPSIKDCVVIVPTPNPAGVTIPARSVIDVIEPESIKESVSPNANRVNLRE